MSQFFSQPASTGYAPEREPLDDEAAPATASSSSSSQPETFFDANEKTNTFRISWIGTIDEIASDSKLAITKLIFSDSIIGASHGILVGGSIKLTNSSFPMDLLISSKQFKNTIIVSPKDGRAQQGVVLAYPGIHRHGKEHSVLVPHKKDTNEGISKTFLPFTQADIDKDVSFVSDTRGNRTHAELEPSNPLWKIIRTNHVKDGKTAYAIDAHTDIKKRENGGIRVSLSVYEAACDCFMTNVVPHLVKQAFSDIEFGIERAGAEWSDPLPPSMSDPRYRQTPYEISAEVMLCYQLLDPK